MATCLAETCSEVIGYTEKCPYTCVHDFGTVIVYIACVSRILLTRAQTVALTLVIVMLNKAKSIYLLQMWFEKERTKQWAC